MTADGTTDRRTRKLDILHARVVIVRVPNRLTLRLSMQSERGPASVRIIRSLATIRCPLLRLFVHQQKGPAPESPSPYAMKAADSV
jgi:hypothetical protein